MSDIDQNDLRARNATAYFETRAAADAAVNDLVAAGIVRDRISVAGTGALGTTPTSGDRSFWDELKGLFLPAEDQYAYAEGLRRGGVLVSVRTENSDYERVLEILDRDGAVDLDKQEASWREEGWTGYPGEDAAASTAAVSMASPADSGAVASSKTAGSPRMATASASAEEVVPVYEEQLRVGKRDVSHGRVRIRSYVVETPVNEQVRLHSESVQVERKPVDRPIAAGDALFQDRVIEAEERAEEAVVGKETRVKEELTLRKTATDRTQDISDTVRHTEVEIQDDRGGGLGSTTSDVSGQIAEHMDVIASDGVKIGTVDHLDGPDKIKLAKSTSPDGQHHYIPVTWVDHVDAHVHLTQASAEVRAGW
jgi:uncharacterized protein (TIGR02271 family)